MSEPKPRLTLREIIDQYLASDADLDELEPALLAWGRAERRAEREAIVDALKAERKWCDADMARFPYACQHARDLRYGLDKAIEIAECYPTQIRR